MDYEKKLGYSYSERQLMLHSNYVMKEFPELFDILKKHETMNETAGRMLSQNLQQTLDREVIIKIYEISKSEWTAVKDGFNFKVKIASKHSHINCQLCNQQPLVRVHYIKNKENNKILVVGSECINKYDINVDVQKGVSRDEFFKLQRTQTDKIIRLQKFIDKYPNASKDLDNWRRSYNDYPVMIPLEYENEYFEVLNEANNIYRKYLDGKLGFKSIVEFEICIKKMSDVKRKINTYIEENTNNEFIVNSNINKWLLELINIGGKNKSSREALFNQIKLTGHMDSNSIPFIHEENFIKKMASKINILLDKTNFYIYDYDFNNGTFQYKLKNNYAITFMSRFTDTLKLYTDQIIDNNLKIDNEVEDIKRLINVCQISDKESLAYALDVILTSELSKIGIYIEWFGLNYDRIIVRYLDNGFYTPKASLFVNILKNFILLHESKCISELESSLKGKKDYQSIEKLKNEISDFTQFEYQYMSNT